MRHTKIVATVGPASSQDDTLEALVRAGVDVFRLNFSHGTHATHADVVRRIRAAAERSGRVVAILQDLSGPKIRTGRLVGGAAVQLHSGKTLTIETGDFAGNVGKVSTSYAPLAQAVTPGQRLLLDDGRIELQVEATDGRAIRTTVVHGGPLAERKGINAPGLVLPTSAPTPKDRDDLAFGLSLGVDLVALSFVQSAADLVSVRAAMAASGAAETPLVAKLERPAALQDLDAILDHCQAVMVARGDLGLEMPLEQVPRAQKAITRSARARGIPVIVATQVLESMRQEPRPTRAEVSDAANAVDDGVDAIMLAGETAAGAWPVRAVETLDAIIRDAEQAPPADVGPTGGSLMRAGHGPALCEAAVTLADRGHATAIVAVTRGGNTARMLSWLRPRTAVVAATERADVARRLALYRSVTPLAIPFAADVVVLYRQLGELMLARGLAEAGATVVAISVSEDLEQPGANFLKLLRL